MLKPLGDRVIIEVKEEEEKSVGGIVLTSASKEKSQSGVIVAVGQGRTLDNGTTLPVTVAVNQTVLFEKYTGQEVKHDGKEYLILHEKDIIAIVE
ncbi:co-chaperone GroES [Vagococcus hydrophili]|uniref:Co-chaperonin GroES n=1 Tax=Vagococcus hydrophili TaxID=2714947 RepID=A0A6G8ARB9_9ENTE|nr:co-chaperone GroES [Vagococcus hydrophili]QIL47628.1 co-chaperone GroES [Vagococcus hydrophili]